MVRSAENAIPYRPKHNSSTPKKQRNRESSRNRENSKKVVHWYFDYFLVYSSYYGRIITKSTQWLDSRYFALAG